MLRALKGHRQAARGSAYSSGPRMRQEDQELKAILDCVASSYPGVPETMSQQNEQNKASLWSIEYADVVRKDTVERECVYI